MFSGIEHFAIASPDPRGLAEWYTGTLGFRIVFEYDGNYFVRAQNGVMLEIVPATGARVEEGARLPGIRHIAIAVDNFDGAYRELQGRGVGFTGAPYDNQGNRIVFFTDCDGNLLHLIKRLAPLP